MTLHQIIILLVLVVALLLFITERWRYDIVALMAALCSVPVLIVKSQMGASLADLSALSLSPGKEKVIPPASLEKPKITDST